MEKLRRQKGGPTNQTAPDLVLWCLPTGGLRRVPFLERKGTEKSFNTALRIGDCFGFPHGDAESACGSFHWHERTHRLVLKDDQRVNGRLPADKVWGPALFKGLVGVQRAKPFGRRRPPVPPRGRQGDEEKGVSKRSADALPWRRTRDMADKYAGDRGTDRL